MYRKMLGVVTAVAAALLLVGVAWATGDRGSDDSSSASIAASSRTDVSSSASPATRSTRATLDSDTSAGVEAKTSADAGTSASVDADTSTSIHLVDTSSTSTTIDSSTSTSVDDGLTVPITIGPRTFDVNGAGTIIIQVVAGRLVLVDVVAASGWSVEVDKADARDVKVEFENGDSDAEFEAKIRDGELRVEIEGD